jgi:hypothetical protein
MMEPSLALQKAIRARLIATSAVTALVPAANVLDKNNRPEVFPSIIIGEGQTVPGDGLARNRHTVFADLHLWASEAGLMQAKAIAGGIRQAFAAPFYTIDGHHVADLHITSTRFLRDPDGQHSHGIVTIEADLVELAS